MHYLFIMSQSKNATLGSSWLPSWLVATTPFSERHLVKVLEAQVQEQGAVRPLCLACRETVSLSPYTAFALCMGRGKELWCVPFTVGMFVLTDWVFRDEIAITFTSRCKIWAFSRFGKVGTIQHGLNGIGTKVTAWNALSLLCKEIPYRVSTFDTAQQGWIDH